MEEFYIILEAFETFFRKLILIFSKEKKISYQGKKCRYFAFLNVYLKDLRKR